MLHYFMTEYNTSTIASFTSTAIDRHSAAVDRNMRGYRGVLDADGAFTEVFQGLDAKQTKRDKEYEIGSAISNLYESPDFE